MIVNDIFQVVNKITDKLELYIHQKKKKILQKRKQSTDRQIKTGRNFHQKTAMNVNIEGSY